MYIHEKIYERVIEKARELTITDVRIGLGYTLVELDQHLCGISYSFLKELNPSTCTVVEDSGNITGKKASYLIEKIFSYNLLDSTLAIATANAILNNNQKASGGPDVMELIKPTDTVVMIGYFSPLVPLIQKKAKKLIICERSPRGESLPDYAAYFELKRCDVAFVSATTLINKTIDSILDTTEAPVLALLGPSTIMDEEIFSKTGITHLCGSIVSNCELAKRIVSEGGGTRKLKAATKKGCVECQS